MNNIFAFEPTLDKDQVYIQVKQFLSDRSLKTGQEDFQKPWGGYIYITADSEQEFLQLFFPEVELLGDLQIQPKILVVAPQTRLSWQYHHRRSELWKVIYGPVGVVRSEDDSQPTVELFNDGQLIEVKKGERHRLCGAENWGVVAEIWKHTDPANPSNEEDIIRLEDDFGRK